MIVPWILASVLSTGVVQLPTSLSMDSPPKNIVIPQDVSREALATKQAISSTENYLPRKLYPGTYKNFCGPTPEVTISDGCNAHGWHGDEALDEVDAACQLHDVSYCACETQLLSRKYTNAQGNPQQQTSSLSSMVALRFFTLPTLNKLQAVDQEYLNCVHKADTQLISTGIKIRGQQQRTNCETDPSLGWFCQEGGTLQAFETVSLKIFLKDLDSDEVRSIGTSRTTLVAAGSDENGDQSSPYKKTKSLAQLELKRQEDLLAEIKSGKDIRDASSSDRVAADEEALLQELQSRF